MGRKSREKKERKEKIERGEIVMPKKEKSEIRPVAICKGIILAGTGLALFTPLIISGRFFFPFVGPKSLYFMGLAEVIFAAWLILQFFTKEYRPRLGPVLLSVVLFVSILTLSSIFGVDPSRSVWSKYERMTGLLMWFHLLAFFLVISSTFKTKSDWFKILSISSFVAFVISIFALGPKIGINFLKNYPTREGATIGNSSFLGTYLLFNFFLTIYLFIKTKGILKIYPFFSLAVVFLALISIGARAAAISTIGGLILLFLVWMIVKPKIGMVKALGVIFLIVFASGSLGTMYLALRPGNYVYKEVTHMATKSRLVVWQIGWKGFLERPWIGWGPENFELAFVKHFDPRLSIEGYGREVWFDRAHNVIVDTLVASGIVGLFGYLLVFFSIFYVLWRKYFKDKNDFWLVSIISTVLISYFVQNLTVFDMVSSYLMWFLVLGLAGSAVVSQSNDKSSDLSEDKLPKYYSDSKVSGGVLYSFVILCLFSFSFFEFIIKPVRADAYVIKSIRTVNSKDRVALYKKTLSLSPIGRYQIRDFFADNTIKLSFSKLARITQKKDLVNEFSFISDELKKSTKQSPLDFRAYLKLGKIYNDWARYDKSKTKLASKALERAIELSPRNQQAYWALAQTRLYQGRNEEAFSLAKKAVDIEPRLMQSYKVWVQVAYISKNDKEVKEISKKALDMSQELMKEFPGNLNFYKDGVVFAQILGDNNKAKEIAQKAIRINPKWKSYFDKVLNEKSLDQKKKNK